MKKMVMPFTLLLLVVFAVSAFPQPSNFSTSLHATREGKAFWYNAENGGFETLTNVPIEHENVACQSCHPATDAAGNEYGDSYAPSCADCHPNNNPDVNLLDEATCYKCHGRQSAEAFVHQYSDVHRDAGMKCWDCHGTEDMHGDGTVYQSMLQPGAIKTDCVDCHATLPGTHASNDPHGGKLHCDACHSQSAITCYNCHFESQEEHHLKRAKGQVKNFVLLANRMKDGKVGTLSFQSLTYKGHSWVAFGPYHAHNITKEGARTCADCHQNMGGDIAAIDMYNSTGDIVFFTWNDDDKTQETLTGVIPLPMDYARAWKMDFLTYDGNTSDPVAPSTNWSYIGENTPDGHQLLFASPLTKVQMAKIGMDTTMTVIPVEFASFSGSQVGDVVVLSWMTATETNNSGFEVQRSIDGKYFERVDFVEGNGTTTEAKSYTFTDKVSEGSKIYYRLKQVDLDGTYSYSTIIEVDIAAPSEYALDQNYPNPFNPSTTIAFSLPVASSVKIAVYNVQGSEVAVVADQSFSAGRHSIQFDASDLSSGAYYYTITAGDFTATKKMLLMK